MAKLRYVSRTDGPHDRRWVDALRSGGHDVRTILAQPPRSTLQRLRQDTTPCDLVVAGPMTDMVPVAVEADVAPVLAISWAFDVLLETEDSAVQDRMVRALSRVRGVPRRLSRHP